MICRPSGFPIPVPVPLPSPWNSAVHSIVSPVIVPFSAPTPATVTSRRHPDCVTAAGSPTEERPQVFPYELTYAPATFLHVSTSAGSVLRPGPQVSAAQAAARAANANARFMSSLPSIRCLGREEIRNEPAPRLPAPPRGPSRRRRRDGRPASPRSAAPRTGAGGGARGIDWPRVESALYGP